jgi:hypothetical protein
MSPVPAMSPVHQEMEAKAGKKRQDQKQASERNVNAVLVDKEQGGKHGKADQCDPPARPVPDARPLPAYNICVFVHRGFLRTDGRVDHSGIQTLEPGKDYRPPLRNCRAQARGRCSPGDAKCP